MMLFCHNFRQLEVGTCLIDEEFDGEVASTGYCVLHPKKRKIQMDSTLNIVSELQSFCSENQSGQHIQRFSDAKVKEFRVPIP